MNNKINNINFDDDINSGNCHNLTEISVIIPPPIDSEHEDITIDNPNPRIKSIKQEKNCRDEIVKPKKLRKKIDKINNRINKNNKDNIYIKNMKNKINLIKKDIIDINKISKNSKKNFTNEIDGINIKIKKIVNKLNKKIENDKINKNSIINININKNKEEKNISRNSNNIEGNKIARKSLKLNKIFTKDSIKIRPNNPVTDKSGDIFIKNNKTLNKDNEIITKNISNPDFVKNNSYYKEECKDKINNFKSNSTNKEKFKRKKLNPLKELKKSYMLTNDPKSKKKIRKKIKLLKEKNKVNKFIKKNNLEKKCFDSNGIFKYSSKNKYNCQKLQNFISKILINNKDKIKSINMKSDREKFKIAKKIISDCTQIKGENSINKKCRNLNNLLKDCLSEIIYLKNQNPINGPSNLIEDFFIGEKNSNKSNKSSNVNCDDILIDIKNSNEKKEEGKKKIIYNSDVEKEKIHRSVSGPGTSDIDIILTKKLQKKIEKNNSKDIKTKKIQKLLENLRNNIEEKQNKTNSNKINPYINGPKESSKDILNQKDSKKLKSKKFKSTNEILEEEIEKKNKLITQKCEDNVELNNKEKKKKKPEKKNNLVNIERKKISKRQRQRKKFSIQLDRLERLRKECKNFKKYAKRKINRIKNYNTSENIQLDKRNIDLLSKCKYNRFLSKSFVRKVLLGKNNI